MWLSWIDFVACRRENTRRGESGCGPFALLPGRLLEETLAQVGVRGDSSVIQGRHREGAGDEGSCVPGRQGCDSGEGRIACQGGQVMKHDRPTELLSDSATGN